MNNFFHENWNESSYIRTVNWNALIPNMCLDLPYDAQFFSYRGTNTFLLTDRHDKIIYIYIYRLKLPRKACWLDSDWWKLSFLLLSYGAILVWSDVINQFDLTQNFCIFSLIQNAKKQKKTFTNQVRYFISSSCEIIS